MNERIRVRCPACNATACWDMAPAVCTRCGVDMVVTAEPCREPPDEPVVVEGEVK